MRALNGNAVLRWGWRPGSTLIVVWQQRRSEFDRLGDFDLGRDPRTLFETPADDVFLVKLAYWLNP